MTYNKTQSILKIRISNSDVHYAGGLVAGAKIMELFGDAATELLIRRDGDEGLLRAYKDVEFLAPVHAGDYLEVHATLTRVGRTSRDMTFTALKIINRGKKVLKKPVLVARARGTCVVKK